MGGSISVVVPERSTLVIPRRQDVGCKKGSTDLIATTLVLVTPNTVLDTSFAVEEQVGILVDQNLLPLLPPRPVV